MCAAHTAPCNKAVGCVGIYIFRGHSYVVSVKRAYPVAGGCVAQHRLLIQTRTQQEYTVNGFRGELQLHDSPAVPWTYDWYLSNKVNTSTLPFRRCHDIGVLCAGRSQQTGTLCQLKALKAG